MTPAIYDFETIRKRMEELKKEDEGTQNGVDVTPREEPTPDYWGGEYE